MQSAMGARAESWDKLPSMAERYDAMPKRLDAMVEGAIRLLSADIQVSWESDLRDQVQKIIELLDEYAFQFRVWTNDISSHEYLSESGDLICQSLDWRIVLSIISTKANAVADTTNQIFESLWIDAEAILKTLDLVHEIKGKDWYGPCCIVCWCIQNLMFLLICRTDLLKDLEKKTERIGISMHRLSDVKVKIEEIKSTVTAKDIQHGILNDKYSARGTVLSFGMSLL